MKILSLKPHWNKPLVDELCRVLSSKPLQPEGMAQIVTTLAKAKAPHERTGQNISNVDNRQIEYKNMGILQGVAQVMTHRT